MKAIALTRQPVSSASLTLWLLVAPLCLWIVAELFRGASCALAGVLAVIPTIPLLAARFERDLCNRRLILGGATSPTSWVRRWFWGGHVTLFKKGVTSFAFAFLLLAMTVRLTPTQWAILLVDGLLMAIIYRWMVKGSAGELQPEKSGALVRNLPSRKINTILLVALFAGAQFFYEGAQDMRVLDMETVAETAMERGRALVECAGSGLLVGGLEAAEDVGWAIAQRVIPSLPTPPTRLLGWVGFLFQVTLLCWLVTDLLLGVIVLVEGRRDQAEALIGHGTFAKTFIATIVVLALLSSYAVTQLRNINPSQWTVPLTTVARWIDPCQAQGQEQVARETQASLTAQLQASQGRIDQALGQRIDREVDLLFLPVERAVEDYLDWYFTIAAEYQRLATLVVGDFARFITQELETRLFEETGFHGQLASIEQQLQTATVNQLTGVTSDLKEALNRRMRQNPCIALHLDTATWVDVERDLWRAGTAGSSATAAGVATTLLSKKVAGSVAAKIGAKKSMQLAANALAKLAAKKGGSTLAAAFGAAAVCAPGGLVSIACGIGAGLATYVAVDKIAIEIDEAVNREAMRADIAGTIAEAKATLKQDLRGQQQRLVANLVQQIETTIDGQFIPARDGL